ncbi:MAG: hypothetical protein SNJ74_12365 [Fimbriimonadaceae bacterium]
MKRPAAPRRLAAFTFVVFAALLAPTADAERLLFTPMGRKLPFGEVRLQHFFEGGQPGVNRTTLGVGFSLLFDGAITWENGLLGGEEGLSLDLSYNLIAPFTDVNPGFSLGVIDALDRTADGRGIYFAGTWRIGMIGDYNQATPLETTIGFMTNRRHAVFVGARFPFTDQLLYLVEYDTAQVVHGLEVRPFRHGAVRLIDRGGTSIWSVGATYRF